jgi:hypothetical protein
LDFRDSKIQIYFFLSTRAKIKNEWKKNFFTIKGKEEERDGEEERIVQGEQELGKEWGHAALSRTVYGNNPTVTTRGTKTHPIWKTVKFLKMCTAYGTTVHNKYTHVCVTPITDSQAGKDGDDQDGDGP